MKYSAKYYEDFKQKYPVIAQSYDKLALDCRQAGPLDSKITRGVKLGIAIGIGSEGDIQNQVKLAMGEGFTPYEIRHAIIQSLTTAGFPKMIMAMVLAEEMFSENG